MNQVRVQFVKGAFSETPVKHENRIWSRQGPMVSEHEKLGHLFEVGHMGVSKDVNQSCAWVCVNVKNVIISYA